MTRTFIPVAALAMIASLACLPERIFMAGESLVGMQKELGQLQRYAREQEASKEFH